MRRPIVSPMQRTSPAGIVSTPVDGIEVLGALSPSRAGDFVTCPLMYRYRTVDKLPEEPSVDAVRGTLVHKVLEDLFDLPAAERTRDRAADLLVPSWDALLEQAPELAEMFGGEGRDVASWLTSCREVLTRYFTLEDPRRLEPAERELYVEALLDSKLLLRGFVDRLDIAPDGRIRVVDYKGLALDTPLPTPTGWTTMAEVQVGDHLLGSDGQPVAVTAKSGVHHRPCFRVTFRDLSWVVSDNVHLWRVVTNYRQTHTTQTVTTDQLHELVAQRRRENRPRSVWVEAASTIDLPDVDRLPVAPWLLGAWLGDGDTRGGGLTVGPQDYDDMLTLVKEHWSRKVSARREKTAWRLSMSKLDDHCTFGHSDFRPATPGHKMRRCAHEEQHAGMDQWNVSLSTELERAALLGTKHIPRAYLRAGTSQRLALLQGLMDTDGWWNKTRRRAGFTTTDDRLAADVVELLHTLGVNPRHFQKQNVSPVRPGRTWHVIEFTPSLFNPFSLPRKAAACEGAITVVQSALARRRIICSVEPTTSVSTQCIEVDSDDSLYLCGTGFIPTHNTGRSPGEAFEAKALFQMRFYALAIWRTRGVVPAMLQLIYLGNGEVLRYEPDEADLLATERKVEAIWRAITECKESGDWRPNRSALCSWCSYQAHCPEFGGTILPLPEVVPVPEPAGDLDTDEDVRAP